MTSTPEKNNLTTPVTEVLNKHVSVRQYTDQDIDDDLLITILNASRRSPTSSNMQTYSIVVVRNPEVKKELAVLTGGQKHIEACPVFIAFCADITRLEAICEMHGQTLTKNLETTLVSSIDAALVGMSVQTAAESFGLSGVMIGGIRNNPKEAAELLELPKGVYITYGMCLGWPKEDLIPDRKPRLAEHVVIHKETYKVDNLEGEIRTYNQQLKAHYEAQNRNLDDDAWSGPIAKKQEKPNRPKLKETLESMGFSLD